MTGTASLATQSPPPVPFAFKDHQIRTVVNEDGNPWFVARDVCAALTIPWRGDTLRAIKPEWATMRRFRIDEKNRLVKVISEPAVYKLAFRSNKPEADEFTNWVASEVLPAIRKTGQFQAQAEPQPSLSRRSTAKDRNRLAALMDTYIGALGVTPSPEAYKAAWKKLHRFFGVHRIEDLTVDQVVVAERFLEELTAGTAPKALPAPEGPDLHALAVANHRNYRPEMRIVEEAVTKAQAQLHVIMDAVRRAAHEADGSSITLDTSLAQKSSELVMNRAEVIRKELFELEGLAVLGFAGISTHLELKHARRRLREIERESKGRFRAGEALHALR